MERGKCGAIQLALRNLCRIDCAKPDHASRYLVAFERKAAKVLTAHDRGSLDDILTSDGAADCPGDSLYQLRIIVGCWRDLGVADLNNRRKTIGYPCRRGDAPRATLDRTKDDLPCFLAVCPDSKLKMNLVGYYVVLDAAMYRPDCDPRGIQRRILAADYGLGRQDRLGGYHYRILGCFGPRAV